ncbi:MAG: efflux RND transporter periplasmic adaptor subunit [Proteobacteria bacterium]|nr:efflux RND transporter periplasmic adaptor subunit [Pseudomonadota bacterium]
MFRFLGFWLLSIGLPLQAAQLVTQTASYEKLPLERCFDGTVEAVKQATVSAETKGRVEQIFFDIGDKVPKGAVILTLVSNEQREAINQAQAKLTEAQANYESDAKEYERMNTLFKENIVSKSDWDKITARFNIAKAQVSAAQAALKTAKEQLSYTEIRAPYGGVVSARHVELGEAVFPGKALMSGFEPSLMRVQVDLPQAVAQKVSTLKMARLIRDDNSVIIPSKIILYPQADPATSTVRARLELPENNGSLYPGEFIKVWFTVGDVQRLLVPSESVVYRSEVSGIYVVKDNTPELRQIRLGNRFGDKIEVLAGLQAGELVAQDPIAAGIELHETKIKKINGKS